MGPFRGQLNDLASLYAFLSQIIAFADAELEKQYVFSRLLFRKLPVTRERFPMEIQQQSDMESHGVQQTGSGSIKLKRGTAELEPVKAKDVGIPLVDESRPSRRSSVN